ncbi:MAG: DUF3300 domain-containing protein [Gammaproteobacteria bacterium]|nr:DUF3300 domain-containing protein [Gammaproteobacteria bacterium]
MNIRHLIPRLTLISVTLLLSLQVAAKEYTQAELDQMMAPVALYPDALLSQLLMASTYPDQVANAANWSEENPKQQGDEAVQAVQDKGWDPSVASLVAFPQVLSMMGGKPDWVKQMGDAFLAEPEKVMETVQGLRRKAKEAGNLESSEQQKVTVDNTTDQTVIVVESKDPQVIYVPAYNPTVVYGTWWWPAYPPFYYPPPPGYGFGSVVAAGIAFGVGIAITNSIWGGFDWRRNDININVNKYNNINVNRRLDVRSNTVSWKRDVRNSGSKLGDRNNRQVNRLDGADRRENFRGRDQDREKARAALQGKGLDPAAERRKLSGSGGESVRDQVGRVDRNTGGGDKVAKRAGGNAERSRERVAAGGRDQGSSGRRARDNAFSGLSDRAGSRRITERGAQSSSRSFRREGGGGARAGGGGRAGGLRR